MAGAPPAVGAGRPSARVAFALLIFLAAYALFVIGQVWLLDANGLTRATGTVPYWDFANLWGGSQLAITGRLALLGDPIGYRHALGLLFGTPPITGEWSYPPTALLLGAPLALLPVGAAYLVWTAGTIALFAGATRPLRLPAPWSLLAILGPALVWNVALGQNGAWTGALLLGGLLQARRRPVLAGMLLGCLVTKPHLATLAPVFLLAERNGRALAAAALTAAALVLLSALAFGWEAWRLFLHDTQPMMRAIMEAPFPQGYQVRPATTFILARALGLAVAPAYLAQLASAAAAVALVLSRPVPDPQARALLAVALTFLVTPYGYTYALVALAAPIAWLMARSTVRGSPPDPAALLAWLVPVFPILHLADLLVPLAPIAIALLCVRLVATARGETVGRSPLVLA